MNNLVIDSILIYRQIVHSVNIWFWVAIIEFFVILYLINRLMSHPKKKHEKLRKQLMLDPINLSNTINSAFNSKPLYDKLKKQCHPDKFVNTVMENKANELFQEIQANKYNYNKLKDLEEDIIKYLNKSEI